MGDKDELKDALRYAFERAHYRKPTKKESERIDKAVDSHGIPGKRKEKK